MAEEKTTITQSYSEGQEASGIVTKITLYGPMVDLGSGEPDALLHLSQLGDSGAINVGDEITGYVLKVDAPTNRVVLTLEKPPQVSWSEIQPNTAFSGQVTRIEPFGVFVDIGAERQGMVHVSELADNYVKSPEDVVSIGQEVEVRVLKADRRKRQIDLTMKQEVVQEIIVDEVEEDYEVLTAMEAAFRRAQEGEQELKPKSDNVKQTQTDRRRAEREDLLKQTLRSHSQSE